MSFKTFSSNIKTPVGNLFIPRDNMPQIRNLSHFKTFLEKFNIKVQENKKPLNSLKIAQLNYNDDKVRNLMTFYEKHPNQYKKILTTSDNYVFDGNHRYLAWYNLDKPLIGVIQVDLPFDKLYNLITDYDGTAFEN